VFVVDIGKRDFTALFRPRFAFHSVAHDCADIVTCSQKQSCDDTANLPCDSGNSKHGFLLKDQAANAALRRIVLFRKVFGDDPEVISSMTKWHALPDGDDEVIAQTKRTFPTQVGKVL
jgi:hypothetical protein